MNSFDIRNIALNNQMALAKALDFGLVEDARILQALDAELATLLGHKADAFQSTQHYIWRTQDDGKVRSSHADRDDRIYSMDHVHEDGHPGEPFGCRCWAEPVGGDVYVNQLLISPVNDSAYQWTDVDFVLRYISDTGGGVTLQETGHLGFVIDHFATEVITRDGTKGGYQAVNRQIIARAQENGEGRVDYDFSGNYKFGDVTDLVFLNGRYSLGHSTVEGIFDGDARIEKSGEKEYLVINGVMNYEFDDEFEDPFEAVERLMLEEGISRGEAQRRLGGSTDEYGTPYYIRGSWKTKFNAVAKVNK